MSFLKINQHHEHHSVRFRFKQKWKEFAFFPCQYWGTEPGFCSRPLLVCLIVVTPFVHVTRTVEIIPSPCRGPSGKSSATTSVSSSAFWSASVSTASSTTSTWWTRSSPCSRVCPTLRSEPSDTPPHWQVTTPPSDHRLLEHTDVTLHLSSFLMFF